MEIGIQNSAQEAKCLSECLFDRASSWKIVSGDTFANGQLSIVANGGVVRVEWIAQDLHRPDKTAPTSIHLLVAASDLAHRTAWDVKAELMTNFISTGAGPAQEPLSTPFLQSLMEKGYTISRISNARVSDAKLKLNLASHTSLEKVYLNAALTLECDVLSLTDVTISDCNLVFRVGGGTWSDVRVSGGKTALTGHLGTTVMDEKCRFDGGYLAADLRSGRVSTTNMSERIGSGMVVDNSLVPVEMGAYFSRPLTPEEQAAMNARIASFKPREVAAAEWKDVQDLGLRR